MYLSFLVSLKMRYCSINGNCTQHLLTFMLLVTTPFIQVSAIHCDCYKYMKNTMDVAYHL